MGRSAAYDEFVMNRCEEILENDKEYQEISEEMDGMEDDIKKHLEGDALKKFISYIILKDKSEMRAVNLLYRFGRNDRLEKISAD